MAIEKIEVAGYKSLKSVSVELSNLNVLIGPNGVGKSNFIGAFKFLNQIVERNLQSYVRQEGGADRILHFGRRITPRLSLTIEAKKDIYSVELVPTADGGLYFESEKAGYKGYASWDNALGKGQLETRLPDDIAQFKKDRGYHGSSYHVLNRLQSWKLYHFHDTSSNAAVKQASPITDNIYLRPDASNLAPFLYFLREVYPSNYDSIVRSVRLAAPYFGDFLLRPSPFNEGFIQLEWMEKGSDFPLNAHAISDGTLRFICLSTLLLQPNLPSTLLLDEPELGLHPAAIQLLSGMLQSASQKTQVIVSTQSVPLVNAFLPEDILVTERIDGTTSFTRLDSDDLAFWLEDYGLGDLWVKNIIGGRP